MSWKRIYKNNVSLYHHLTLTLSVYLCTCLSYLPTYLHLFRNSDWSSDFLTFDLMLNLVISEFCIRWFVYIWLSVFDSSFAFVLRFLFIWPSLPMYLAYTGSMFWCIKVILYSNLILFDVLPALGLCICLRINYLSFHSMLFHIFLPVDH